MRDLLKDSAIDGKTLVRYFKSNWHPLREELAILAPPPPRATPKAVRSGRPKTKELVVLGVLAIILELILVHWTGLVLGRGLSSAAPGAAELHTRADEHHLTYFSVVIWNYGFSSGVATHG